jgi:hypothetical protein
MVGCLQFCAGTDAKLSTLMLQYPAHKQAESKSGWNIVISVKCERIKNVRECWRRSIVFEEVEWIKSKSKVSQPSHFASIEITTTQYFTAQSQSISFRSQQPIFISILLHPQKPQSLILNLSLHSRRCLSACGPATSRTPTTNPQSHRRRMVATWASSAIRRQKLRRVLGGLGRRRRSLSQIARGAFQVR